MYQTVRMDPNKTHSLLENEYSTMVKKGPCLHCGTNCTPLWRNGPIEKPVLCNACGSRYKLKGNLENYLPKNVQFQLDSDHGSETNVHGGGNNDFINNVVHEEQLSSQNLPADNQNLPTGGRTEDLLNCRIPTKKRTRVVYREMTAMDVFQKQLLNIMRSGCVKLPDESNPEEVLMFDQVNNFIPSNEVGGSGCILLNNNNNNNNVTSAAAQGSSSASSANNNN